MSDFKSIFSVDELIMFFDPYFRRYHWGENCLEVMSLNTGHFWLLIKNPSADIPYTILHKHRKNHKYHRQCGSKSLASAIKKIKRHDQYFLKYRV